MKRLALLCLAVVAATNAYNLVIQEITLKGDPITGNTVTCDKITYFHIEGKEFNTDCYDFFGPTTSPTDPPTLEARKLVYVDKSYTTKKTKLNFEIILSEGSKVTFAFSPDMNKVGQLKTAHDKDTNSKFIPLESGTTTASSATTTTTAPQIPNCKEGDTPNIPPNTPCTCVDELSIPGCTSTVAVEVSYYILDEAGNPAAVWAAVIEGIILMVLVGACFYFFFWKPRSRSVGAASADPYKDGPNYTVSYANSGYNNQRIDAFQNPPAAPAAPARPANSSYMADYMTDNIGARPAAAAPAASAANPVQSDFRPGHQRFDSSGLVTVNLS